MPDEHQPGPSVETGNLLLIVVGAHLRAETADRPLAYRLRERIGAWLEKHASAVRPAVVAVVCTDLLYMNSEELQGRPTISLGGPGVNALSQYFADKLHTTEQADSRVVIQLDPELIDLRAAVWGMDHDATVDALELFNRQHLGDFLRAVATQVEPREE